MVSLDIGSNTLRYVIEIAVVLSLIFYLNYIKFDRKNAFILIILIISIFVFINNMSLQLPVWLNKGKITSLLNLECPEDGECPKLECPKLECPKLECPKLECPEKECLEKDDIMKEIESLKKLISDSRSS